MVRLRIPRLHNPNKLQDYLGTEAHSCNSSIQEAEAGGHGPHTEFQGGPVSEGRGNREQGQGSISEVQMKTSRNQNENLLPG